MRISAGREKKGNGEVLGGDGGREDGDRVKALRVSSMGLLLIGALGSFVTGTGKASTRPSCHTDPIYQIVCVYHGVDGRKARMNWRWEGERLQTSGGKG